MNKISMLGLLVPVFFATTLLAQPPRLLEYRTIALNGDKGGTLAVVDGQPRLVNSPFAWTEWTLRETSKGWSIQGQSSSEKPEAKYLTVDVGGKVTLVAEPGTGAYWKLTRKGERLTSFDGTIQAKVGKFNGWYLGFSDDQEEVKRGTRKYKAYRVTLSETLGPRTNLHIFIDGP
jgi:hypothetical protein